LLPLRLYLLPVLAGQLAQELLQVGRLTGLTTVAVTAGLAGLSAVHVLPPTGSAR